MRRPRTTTALALLAAGLLAACGGTGGTTTEEAPAASSAPATTAGPTTQPTTAAPAATIDVVGGEAVGGTQTVKVKKGDHVRIVVNVDAPQELHLHGYEIEKEAEPGTPAVFDFVAEHDGIYELESHAQEAVLVKLVVEP